MSTEDSSYAPKSPDLSSFFSGVDPATTATAPTSVPTPATSISDLHLHSSYSAGAGAYPLQAQPRTQAPGPHLVYGQPQPHQYHNHYNTYHQPPAPAPAPAPASAHQPTAAAYSSNNNGNAFNSYPNQAVPQHHQGGHYLSHQQQQQLLQFNQTPQPQPSYHHLPTSTAAPSYYTDSFPSTSYQPRTPPSHTQLQNSQSHSISEYTRTLEPSNKAMPPRKAAQVARQDEIIASPVRTKFPTARIKRIMQADEEVGKVAQQTPIAVGKALELFMVQLVNKSAEVAREKNSKRITAPMLKQAIDSTNEWDFLQDIVAKVNEEKEGARSSGKAKPESDSDDDLDAGEVKKKGRGGRKKKAPA
ncbi:DNA polymerase epsilon subunit C [Biscogniauxia mediterranea]|nr:DNA polymerase epsilon subunit C [Biscogniauxia mediterranea]